MANDSGFEKEPSLKFVSLMYHDVYSADEARNLPRTATMYHVTIDQFEEHLREIRDSQLPTYTMSECAAGVSTPGLCLTFDDGWAGTLQNAIPRLSALGMKATILVTRDFVGRDRFCDKSMLSEVARLPNVEIGLHGTTHRMLSACSTDEVLWEFRACREFLESLLGKSVRVASMPGGDWNRRLADCMRQLGLQAVCTSRPGINRCGRSPIGLRRVGVKDVTHAADIRRYCRFDVRRETFVWTRRQIPRWTLGMRNYSRLRRWLLQEPRGHATELFTP